ncbi:MAG: SpoIIE family protein phosphatase [Pirellulales bacterium]|nr:SpoIIE family protein phosphatase [Pirellulales bacterium]
MDPQLAASSVILDSLAEGVYVCDRDRRIVYWNKPAERITGWSAEEVVGRRCLDNLLCHEDKDGRRLCGEEHCPLHRSMATGAASTVPLIVFAQAKDGQRIPMQVTVAPIYDEAGVVVGGVETFREMSTVLGDLMRAKQIQELSLEHDLPHDPRIAFTTAYSPHDIVGGDFYALQRLDADRYGFLLADVMGHGVAAALYTMHLSSLWSRRSADLLMPAQFAAGVNRELSRIVRDESFATAICGTIDASSGCVRFASAGGPPAIVFRSDDSVEEIEASGVPLGMLEDADYDEVTGELRPGDAMLLVSDGALEVIAADGAMLGVDGLVRILQTYGYPRSPLPIKAVEAELLRFSNSIRLQDDVTLIEMRFLT